MVNSGIRQLFPDGIYVKKWGVIGTSGKEWIVSTKRDGTWGCSCPAWINKRVLGPRPDCQHILRVKLQDVGVTTRPTEPAPKATPKKKDEQDSQVTRSITFD